MSVEADEKTTASIRWEGDSREILAAWPKDIRRDFGLHLFEMQHGRQGMLRVRPMPSIAMGVFELKDADSNKWYRLIYLAKIRNTIYVLHCFEKDSAKTDRRDLQVAEHRWKAVQEQIREEKRNEKDPRKQASTRNPG